MSTRTKYALTGKARDSYLELVLAFPLASIKSDEHLTEAQKVMDRLLANGELDDGEVLYLDALSDLVAAYGVQTPKCRKATSGPHSDTHKAVNVGMAAHVTAASEGGPRFDPSLSSVKRMSADNGIWLCQMCAKLIDSDAAKFTKEVLHSWRETAEHLAASEIHQPFAGDASSGHSITFAVDDWSMWKNRGNLPGDAVVIIEGWTRGDVRYLCRIRLCNNLRHEEVLHHLRMEFQRGDEILLSDEYPFQNDDVVLPIGKWITLEVSYGLHDYSVFEQSDSVWFRAGTVGDNETRRWLVAEIDHASVKLPESSWWRDRLKET